MAKDLLQFTSLMDLASTDTTDIKAIRSRLQAEGIYIITFDGVTLTEAEVEEGKDPRVNMRFVGVIDGYEPLKPYAEGEAEPEMVGKAFNQFVTMWLADVAEAIGLVKGQLYERAKFPTAGNMGGVEGTEGWLDGIAGQRVGIRVRHSTNAAGDTRAYYDWLAPKELQKAGFEWEEMGREAMSADGTVLEDPYSK